MIRKIITGFTIFLGFSVIYQSEITAQEIKSDLFVYTIGNFADLAANSPAIKSLVKQIEKDKTPSVILFTGDITKANLLNTVERVEDSIRISFLIKQLQSEYIKNLIFLPGDRDWSYSGMNGLQNVNILERLVENLPFENITWKPGQGCPGPRKLKLAKVYC